MFADHLMQAPFSAKDSPTMQSLNDTKTLRSVLDLPMLVKYALFEGLLESIPFVENDNSIWKDQRS